MVKLQDSVLRTLIYADIFDYPLKPREIYRFLISDKKMTLVSFNQAFRRIEKQGKWIQKNKGYYFLGGRGKIVAIRRERSEWSRRKLKIAQKVTRFLSLIPWVRMVATTGALAMANSTENDDIDLMMVTSENRLWLTRLAAVILIELVGNRRRPGDRQVNNKICLNMFLDERHLMIPPQERDLFSAHELIQLKPLWDKGGIYQNFINQNQWVKKFLPNWKTGKKHEKPSWHGRGRKSVWDFLELLSMKFQLRYMSKRRTTETVESGRVFFHPQDARGWVIKNYQERLRKFSLEW